MAQTSDFPSLGFGAHGEAAKAELRISYEKNLLHFPYLM